MHELAVVIDPSKLANPDLDMRYELPDLISSKSKDEVRGTGYDYVGPSNHLVVFFEANDSELAKEHIVSSILGDPVLGNDLSSASHALVRQDGAWSFFFPPGYTGPNYL